MQAADQLHLALHFQQIIIICLRVALKIEHLAEISNNTIHIRRLGHQGLAVLIATRHRRRGKELQRLAISFMTLSNQESASAALTSEVGIGGVRQASCSRVESLYGQ